MFCSERCPPCLPYAVPLEPPWEAFHPTELTDLDRYLYGITAPVLLSPLKRWFAAKHAVVPHYEPEPAPPFAVRVLRVVRSPNDQTVPT